MGISAILSSQAQDSVLCPLVTYVALIKARPKIEYLITVSINQKYCVFRISMKFVD